MIGGMPSPTITLIGGPTALLRYAGLAILTDPTFSPPGTYGGLTKTRGPALAFADVAPVDVALVSHDHHPDNLDDAGRAALTDIPTVFSTTEAAARVPGVHGLADWESATVPGPDGEVTITAVPAQHGPPGVAEQVGPVVGFVLEAEGWPTLYFSGDNSEVLVVAVIARRFPDVGIVLLCAGAASVPNRGPVLLTVDAERALTIAGLWPDAEIAAVHIEDWAHFGEQREAFEAAVTARSAGERFVSLERGVETTVGPARGASAGR